MITSASRQTALRLLPAVWSVVLATLLLGPALGHGYVLSYDMVWVPDLALRPDFLGLGSGLPRAVPSDAVVAVLDQVVGGMILQKLVLLGCLVGGGIGSLRLAPEESLTGRLVVVTLYQWNPFVAERLLIGHWPVLIGYAVLPWLVDAGRRWRTDRAMPVPVPLLVLLGCLSAGAGLVTAVVLVAFAGARDVRRLLALAALLLAGNAPWLVAGALHVAVARSDPAGAAAFALHGEGSMPAPLTALGLGGIWNAEVVPPSRTGLLGWVSLILLLTLAALGARSWLARARRRDAWAFASCWLAGWLLAVGTWLLPDQAAWLYSHVPGAGLVRDGARILALCVPLTVVLAARGAARVAERLPVANRAPIVVALVLLPVAVLPDLALGLSGRLAVSTYPADYAATRSVLAHDQRGGDVLVLPLSSYRAPSWNGGRKVLDPTGRFLTRDYVASDELVVSGTTLAGEDPQVARAREAIARPTPEARARALGRLGIRYVVVDAATPSSPAVAGRVVVRGPVLRVLALATPVSPDPPSTSSRAAVAVAWAAFLALLVCAALLGSRPEGGRACRTRHTVR